MEKDEDLYLKANQELKSKIHPPPDSITTQHLPMTHITSNPCV